MVRMNQMEIVNKQDGLAAHDDVEPDYSEIEYHYGNSHYEKYPVMKPWVGSNYLSDKHKKLLVLGESHYLPKESIKSHDVDAWYSGSEDSLDAEEKRWIRTRQIIKKIVDNNYCNSAHGIFRNTAKAVNLVGCQHANPLEAMNDIAFMNFFQRPAENEGDSINVVKKDVEVAIYVLKDVIEALAPDLIVFVSFKAAWYGKSIVESLNIPVAVTPHPTCRWWNKQTKKYGGYGRDVIPKFLTMNEWYKA